ncbi:YadA-like family protein, partial [Haemophilus haemolyticus]
KGEQGLQGRDGKDGAQGLPGRDGRDGKDVLNGKVDPTTEGKDGDKYVNTETGDVFVKNKDNWDKAGNIKGPKGDQGPQGLQGEKGEIGARGEQGIQGEKGDKGETPKVTTARGKDGHSTDITFTVTGENPVVANIKDGKDGRTPTIDLNALANAVRRGAGLDVNPQPSGTTRSARRARSVGANPDEVTASAQPATTDSTGSQPGTTDSTASQPVDGTRITAYYDNNGNGKYDPGVDELIGTSDILNGTNGRNGTNGASGHDGRNGKELLSGPVAPTANDGKDGDTYIDSNTGDVHKKENGTWNKIGNIKGPQGVQGDNGKNATANVVDNHNGTHTLTVTNPDGSQTHTTINDGAKGETGAAGQNGKDGLTPTVTIKDGKDGTHTVTFTTDGKETAKFIVKDGKDGKNGTNGSGSNPDDGLKFTGNNEVVNNNKLNSKVMIKGKGVSKEKSETFKSAEGNINVKADGDATLEMQLAKDINLGNDGSVTTGNTVVNNDGITINNADPNKTVSVTENGLNNGGNRIINVAPGVEGTDAVNVNQLRGAVNNIHNDMNKMDKRLSAGIAGAMSSANLYQATSSGKSMLSAGAGTYRGESAVAVGYSRLSDNGKFGVRFSANTNSRGDAGAAASVGYQW